ncbi:MAG: SGNH/GDSL hydrolase family protein [Opitutaceae bacterium]|nr:SGNH/GDSL hydrolase family protein [Opitutaceae bacterium]
MKQVVLVGDSIRLGYEPFVKAALQDVAEVWGPEQNCGHSLDCLKLAHLWCDHRQPDLIHFNCGLHDIRTRFYGEPAGRTLVPLDHYRAHLFALVEAMRTRTRAQLIWASTTPVIDEVAHRDHARWRDFDRHHADVLRYNEAAREVMISSGVEINDLHAAVMARDPATLQNGDGVHYTAEGSLHLASLVARAIVTRLHPPVQALAG